MKKEVVRYSFSPSVCMQEVEETLLLAVLATEGLHGESMVRLHGSYTIDVPRRVCVIDVSNEIGRAISRVFTGFITREFGADSFGINRPDSSQPAGEQAACAGTAC